MISLRYSGAQNMPNFGWGHHWQSKTNKHSSFYYDSEKVYSTTYNSRFIVIEEKVIIGLYRTNVFWFYIKFVILWGWGFFNLNISTFINTSTCSKSVAKTQTFWLSAIVMFLEFCDTEHFFFDLNHVFTYHIMALLKSREGGPTCARIRLPLGDHHFLWNGDHEFPKVPRQYFYDPLTPLRSYNVQCWRNM